MKAGQEQLAVHPWGVELHNKEALDFYYDLNLKHRQAGSQSWGGNNAQLTICDQTSLPKVQLGIGRGLNVSRLEFFTILKDEYIWLSNWDWFSIQNDHSIFFNFVFLTRAVRLPRGKKELVPLNTLEVIVGGERVALKYYNHESPTCSVLALYQYLWVNHPTISRARHN